MSRTTRTKRRTRNYGALGRARGISKSKRLNQRQCRAEQKRQMLSSDDPVVEQPKRISNFWWGFW